MKRHIHILAVLMALLLLFPLIALAADVDDDIAPPPLPTKTEEPDGFASSGDVTVKASQIATDDEDGNLALKLYLLYKGHGVFDGSTLELFEISPIVSDYDKFPFDITWTSYMLSMGDVKKDTAYKNPVSERTQGSLYGPSSYFQFNFKVKEDTYNGYYPISFKVRFLHKGQDIKMTPAAEATITVYVRIMHGKEPATPTPEPTEKPVIEATPKPQARVILNRYEMNPSDVTGGEEFDLKLVIENTNANMAVRNMKCSISELKGTVLPASGSSSFYISSIEAQETTEITLRMQALPEAGVEPVKMTLSMQYDDKNSSNEESEEFILPIHQVIKVEADEPNYPGESFVDEPFNLMMRFYNTGKSTMYNTRVFLESETLEADETLFAGTVAPGGQGLYDVMVTAPSAKLMYGEPGEMFDPNELLPGGPSVMPTPAPRSGAQGEMIEEAGSVGAVFAGYSVNARPISVSVGGWNMGGSAGGGINTMACQGNVVITYEDSNGVKFRKEMPITVNIMNYDMAYQGNDFDFWYGKDYDPSSGFYIDRETGVYYDPMTQMPVDRGVNPLVYIAIAAAIVVVLVVALIVVLNIRKKKLRQREQQLELEAEMRAENEVE